MNQLVESYFLNDIFTIQALTFTEEEKPSKKGYSFLLLPVTKYEKDTSRRECMICLEKIQENECVYTMSCCSNKFHSICMDKMISFQHKKCPICRERLPIIRKIHNRQSQQEI